MELRGLNCHNQSPGFLCPASSVPRRCWTHPKSPRMMMKDDLRRSLAGRPRFAASVRLRLIFNAQSILYSALRSIALSSDAAISFKAGIAELGLAELDEQLGGHEALAEMGAFQHRLDQRVALLIGNPNLNEGLSYLDAARQDSHCRAALEEKAPDPWESTLSSRDNPTHRVERCPSPRVSGGTSLGRRAANRAANVRRRRVRGKPPAGPRAWDPRARRPGRV